MVNNHEQIKELETSFYIFNFEEEGNKELKRTTKKKKTNLGS